MYLGCYLKVPPIDEVGLSTPVKDYHDSPLVEAPFSGDSDL